MQSDPLVSVCIATYNHARFLPECLESVLAQTCSNLEIVVVNDGSSDDSQIILDQYSERDPRVRVFTHANGARKGISASGNLAIEKSRGEYLARLDSDDAWYPEKLERQLPWLRKYPQVGLVYSIADIVEENGRKTGWTLGDAFVPGKDLVEELLQYNHIPHSTVILRRDCLRRIGGYDENLVIGDRDLWLRLVSFWDVKFVPAPLARYRIHMSNSSLSAPRETLLARRLALYQKLNERAASLGGNLSSPRNRALIHLQLAFTYFALEDESTASNEIGDAFRTDPTLPNDDAYLARWLMLRWFDDAMPLPSDSSQIKEFSLWFESILSSWQFDLEMLERIRLNQNMVGALQQAYQEPRHLLYSKARRYVQIAAKLPLVLLSDRRVVLKLFRLAQKDRIRSILGRILNLQLRPSRFAAKG